MFVGKAKFPKFTKNKAPKRNTRDMPTRGKIFGFRWFILMYLASKVQKLKKERKTNAVANQNKEIFDPIPDSDLQSKLIL
jgi:hypothetical protein